MNILNPQLHKAFSLHQSGNIKAAINIYQAIQPEDEEELAKLNELLGIAHAQLNELSKALPYFKKALKLRPHYLSIQNNLATCYKKIGKIDIAIKMYKKILLNNPFQCVSLNNLASLYIQANEEAKAIYLLKKAVMLQPKYADAYYNLGLVDDVKYFKAALDLGHINSAYHHALYLESQKELKESQYYYQLCLKHIENHALGHHGLARVLLAQGKDEDALMHFVKAQGIDPYIPYLMENIAAYYHVKGMHANAIEYWIKALNNTEDRLEILYNIGVAYHYMNRHEDALSYFMMVLEEDPNHQKAHTNIAAIALQNNQKANAISHYEIVLKLDPQNEEVKYILSALKKEEQGFNRSPKGYVANLFDQYAGHYNQHLMKMLRYQLPEKVELILHERYKSNQDKKILDLGCGTGLLGPILKPIAQELYGVDLSPNMLLEATKINCYHHLIEMDAFSYLEACPKFDIILALELCPYIGDIEPLLKLIFKALDKDGISIISIETTDSEQFILSEYARYQHNIMWVKSLINKIGFSILEDEPTTLRTQNSQPVSGHLLVLFKHQ